MGKVTRSRRAASALRDPFAHGHHVFAIPYNEDRPPYEVFADGCEYFGITIDIGAGEWAKDSNNCTWWREAGEDEMSGYRL